jgi:TonB-linked SusC/RagA family outer membrane protein
MQVSKKLTVLAFLAFACLPAAAQEPANASDSVIKLRKQYLNAFQVSGTVTDAATKKPLRGIRVTYKDYSATISDSTGSFNIRVPSPSVSILLEGEGYQTKEIAIKGRSKVTAALFEDTYNSHYDAANLPFGPVSQTKIPFSVSSVQTNGAWGKVTETPSTYLQGRVPGMNVIRRSGTPNIGGSLFLRGITSLYATNQPLIVVDGVIFNNQDFGGSINANHYNDPLSSIDVRDIDNVTVIKDGSSLYGTKGANGVILITTARARELGTKIDLAVFGGVNLAPKFLPVLGADDYRLYLSDVLRSKGLSNTDINALPYMNDDPSNPDYYRYHNDTEWQEKVFDKSYTKNIYLKVTGGDNIARYALSLGYMGSAGVIRNTDLSRYNMRFNGDLNLSKRMTATTNLSFGLNEQTLRDQGASSKTNPVFLALTKSPLLRTNDVSTTGVESPALSDRDTFNIGNPLTLINIAQGVNKSYRFFGSIGFNYEFSKAVSLGTTVGVTNDKVRESFFIPRKGITSDTLVTDIAYSRLGSQVKALFSLYNDTRLSYRKTFGGGHDLSSRIGLRYLYNETEQDRGFGFNSAIDELVSVGTGVNNLRRVGGSFGESNWLSTYLSSDYSYSDKYFLSFNVAVDGSSRFGKNIPGAFTFNGNQYAVLPSLAAAWLVSSESFMQTSFFDVLKLRASIGLTGNDDIGNYTARQTYVSQNLLGLQGLVRGGFGNEQLQWEKVKKLNAGIDVSLLGERISFMADVYRNKTSQMIIYEAAPTASGASFLTTNSGGLTTSGFEAGFNARIINKSHLRWDIGFMVGKYKTTIDQLPETIISSFANATYITRVGAGPNLFYGYKTNGIYQTNIAASTEGLSNRMPDGSLSPFGGGDVRFEDLNNDDIIDANDLQVIGDPNPDLFGSVTSRLQYSKFVLDALFTFSKGNDVYNYTRNQLENLSGYGNQTEAVRNRWRGDGHQTDIPKATWGDPMGNSRFSDRWIEDGSYFRLRTATLSYTLPFHTTMLKYSMVYLTGNNIFTLTKYKGFDPEFSPTESIFGQGVDNTLEPQFRSVQVGIRIGL